MNQPFLRIVGGALIFLGLLWVVAVTVFWSRMPRFYQAMARVAVEKDSTASLAPSENKLSPAYDPYFIQTEFEKVQSKLVLYQVISNLNLTRIWAARFGEEIELTRDSVFQLLKKRLDVVQSRSTALIEIRVRSEDAHEAAQIANEIAKVYREMSMPEELKKKVAAGQSLTPAEFERSQVQIVDSAEPPLRPISPEPLVGFLNLVPGFCLGIGGLVMLAKGRKQNQTMGLAK